MPEKRILRYFKAPELRADPENRKITGHAAVFDKPADIGGFMEQIARGAFEESIGKDDIRALWNHNADTVLGRNRAGTLRLEEDEVGLAIEIDAPDTQGGRDAIVTIGRGDVDQMSFAFNALDELWEKKDGMNWRTIKKAQLFDVSPVTYAAYTQTDASVRSLADEAGVEFEALQRALIRSQHELELDAEDIEIVRKMVGTLSAILPDGNTWSPWMSGFVVNGSSAGGVVTITSTAAPEKNEQEPATVTAGPADPAWKARKAQELIEVA